MLPELLDADIHHLGFPLLSAIISGLIVGLERQWFNGTNLKTTVLICVGAAIFVHVGIHLGGDSAQRIAGQVASGIGFIGAGVIMHEGITVKGVNTAATFWVSAGMGCLAGIGLIGEPIILGCVIAFLNIVLRKLSFFINRIHPVDPTS